MKQGQYDHLNPEEKLTLATQQYTAGNLELAALLYDDLIKLIPNNIELLIFAGKIAFEQKAYPRTIDFLSKALIINPTNAIALFLLGNALLAKGNFKAAEINLLKAVKVNPEFNEAWYGLATLYVYENDKHKAASILLDIIKRDKTHFNSYLQLSLIFKKSNRFLMSNIFGDLYLHYYSGTPLAKCVETVCDTFFLDRDEAYKEAIKQNQIQKTIAINVSQICYYHGEEFKNAPKNLISVPLDKLGEFFCFSYFRRPTAIKFDPGNMEEVNRAISIADTLQSETAVHEIDSKKNIELCVTQKPDFSPGKQLKILILTSIYTKVMQYSARDLANALRRKGCDVYLLIEENDLQRIEMRHYYQEFAKYVPNAAVNINHLYNEYLHEETYNITWWQDPMPEIVDCKPIKWRNRDIAISAYSTFDTPLYNSGAKQVYRQDFCFDPEIFNSSIPLESRKKIVFIGSSYIYKTELFGENGRRIIAVMMEKMVKGQDITDELLYELAEKYEVSFQDIFYHLVPYVVRDTSVEWLCSMADSLDYEVEVYGRWWDENPVTAPFFKGELPHGPKVAEVYNQAKYAISAMNRSINSQRVAEIAACGCIPVLLDERGYPQSEKPHWNDECLYYRTKEELKNCFVKTPKNDPKIIAKNYTYDSFAEKIITYINTGKYPDQPIDNHKDYMISDISPAK
ncbi:MAG: tetratricopeptide repeat protein [Magnetococcales bacterium]|nr:tetratricopeptide repeat protein [Magnetococcales bacterium]